MRSSSLTFLFCFIFLFLTTSTMMMFTSAAKVLFISDVHLEPYYGTSLAARGRCNTTPPADQVLGHYGCDSPKALVQSAFIAAGRQNPELALLSGDLLRHDADDLSVEEAHYVINNITQMLQENFPPSSSSSSTKTSFAVKLPKRKSTPSSSSSSSSSSSLKAGEQYLLYDALGNNGAVPDYHFNVSDATHKYLTFIANSLKDRNMIDSADATEFARCGYYMKQTTLGHKNKPLRILVYNSLLWDVEHTPDTSAEADPCGQLDWIERQLNTSRDLNVPVIMMTHIPPGLDLHEASGEAEKGLPPKNFTYYWYEKYSSRWKSIVTQHQDDIRLLVFAHTHHVTFLADKAIGDIPAIITGAVSPVYFNRPMFITMEFDNETLTPQFESIKQFGLTNFSADATWIQISPDFQTVFDISPSASPTTEVRELQDFYSRACDSEKTTLSWYAYAAAQGKPIKTCSAACRLLSSCYNTHMTRDDTIACYQAGCSSSKKKIDGPETMKIVVGIVVTVVVLTLLFVVFKARGNRRENSGELASLDSNTSATGGGGGGSTMNENNHLNNSNNNNNNNKSGGAEAGQLYQTETV